MKSASTSDQDMAATERLASAVRSLFREVAQTAETVGEVVMSIFA